MPAKRNSATSNTPTPKLLREWRGQPVDYRCLHPPGPQLVHQRIELSYANNYLYGAGQYAVDNLGQPLYTSSHGSTWN